MLRPIPGDCEGAKVAGEKFLIMVDGWCLSDRRPKFVLSETRADIRACRRTDGRPENRATREN